MKTADIAAAGDALMASLAPLLPTPLEAELSDKLAAARRRIEALEMENERLRADLSLVRRIVHRLTEGVAPAPNSAEPAPHIVATRPLTTVDRLPEVGDYLARPGGGRMECDIRGAGFVLSRFIYRAEDGTALGGVYLTGKALRDGCYQYLSRADGKPVTVHIVPQNQAPAEGAAPARQGAVRQVAGVEGPAGSVAPAGQPGEVAG